MEQPLEIRRVQVRVVVDLGDVGGVRKVLRRVLEPDRKREHRSAHAALIVRDQRCEEQVARVTAMLALKLAAAVPALQAAAAHDEKRQMGAERPTFG